MESTLSLNTEQVLTIMSNVFLLIVFWASTISLGMDFAYFFEPKNKIFKKNASIWVKNTKESRKSFKEFEESISVKVRIILIVIIQLYWIIF